MQNGKLIYWEWDVLCSPHPSVGESLVLVRNGSLRSSTGTGIRTSPPVRWVDGFPAPILYTAPLTSGWGLSVIPSAPSAAITDPYLHRVAVFLYSRVTLAGHLILLK